MAVTLVVTGIAALIGFGLLVWPPLGLLIFGVVCLTAGLLVDWENARGKPARPDPRRH